jgi:asparagine synthetase B (glutamine-hydrolysing)
MCGIAGVVHFRKKSEAPHWVISMTNALAHRGLDACGFYNDESLFCFKLSPSSNIRNSFIRI